MAGCVARTIFGYPLPYLVDGRLNEQPAQATTPVAGFNRK